MMIIDSEIECIPLPTGSTYVPVHVRAPHIDVKLHVIGVLFLICGCANAKSSARSGTNGAVTDRSADQPMRPYSTRTS